VILLDTSGVLAALDRRSPRHQDLASALVESAPPRLLSPFVLAELDYLLATRVGAHAQASLLEDVTAGAYRLEEFDVGAVAQALVVMRRFEDLRIGLADASIVVLAERHGCSDVLDEGHFRPLRYGGDTPFRLLPADAL
jgi:predicted nucleic acid-binding protein